MRFPLHIKTIQIGLEIQGPTVAAIISFLGNPNEGVVTVSVGVDPDLLVKLKQTRRTLLKEQDELAEDLEQVVFSLRAAVTAEEKGNSSRRTSKLKEAQQALQKMTETNPELKDLASLLKQVK